MAMELEFWQADGPNGEVLDFAVRVAAWQILPFFHRFKRPDHVYAILRHTGRRQGDWCVWVRDGYTSGTHPAIGKLESVP